MTNIVIVGPPRTGGVTLYKKFMKENPTHLMLGEGFTDWRPDNFRRDVYKLSTCAAGSITKIIPGNQSKEVVEGVDHLRQVVMGAHKLYYTTRLSFEKQCQSMYKAKAVGVFNDEDLKDVSIFVDEVKYRDIAKRLVGDWTSCSNFYDMRKGKIIRLEDRNEPYVHNKSYNIENEWPDISEYINQFNIIADTRNLFNDI